MKKTISIHIPKTGGSAFRGILHKIYGNKLMNGYTLFYEEIQSKNLLDKYDCIHGHINTAYCFDKPKDTSYEIICADDLKAPKKAYF